jgi:geranylgeranyl pyrophosphate synthase
MDDLTAHAALVEGELERWLAARALPDNLLEAVRYAALAPGKRLRPVLVLQSCAAVGGREQHALSAAAAVELIHAFSLVHDDLPALDDDDLRRGRPTLHRHAGEAMAILAGDAMLGLALELVLTEIPSAELARAIAAELIAGTNGMIVGQVYDTLPLAPAPDEDAATRLARVHRNKTGALIRASCRMGALCGGADAAALAQITEYGEAIGLMYQIVDDLLDVTQTTEHLGKAAGKDASRHKLTYPAVHGIEGSRQEIERLRQAGIGALAPLGPAADPLRRMCDRLAERTR